MPGPISDSYDSEFGTGENATNVRDAIQEQVNFINMELGNNLLNIVEVVNSSLETKHHLVLTERDLRIIRFSLNRAKESV
jgi:hypothetical protein